MDGRDPGSCPMAGFIGGFESLESFTSVADIF
jgi:hypothetical protein